MEGRVYKQQMFKRTWSSERYIVTERQMLYYFNGPVPHIMDECSFKLDLSQLTALETDVTKENIVIVRHPKKDLIFMAPDASEYAAWLALFASFCAYRKIIRSGKRGEYVPIPSNFASAIWALLRHIRENGLTSEGIFRTSGSKSKTEELMRSLLVNGVENVKLSNWDIRECASVAKKLLDKLPDSLLTEGLLKEVLQVKTSDDVQAIVRKLPDQNREFLKHLTLTLIDVVEAEAVTLMTVEAITICFAPLLVSRKLDPMVAAGTWQYLKTFLKLCMEDPQGIFGANPPRLKIVIPHIQYVLTDKKVVKKKRSKRASVSKWLGLGENFSFSSWANRGSKKGRRDGGIPAGGIASEPLGVAKRKTVPIPLIASHYNGAFSNAHDPLKPGYRNSAPALKRKRRTTEQNLPFPPSHPEQPPATTSLLSYQSQGQNTQTNDDVKMPDNATWGIVVHPKKRSNAQKKPRRRSHQQRFIPTAQRPPNSPFDAMRRTPPRHVPPMPSFYQERRSSNPGLLPGTAPMPPHPATRYSGSAQIAPRGNPTERGASSAPTPPLVPSAPAGGFAGLPPVNKMRSLNLPRLSSGEDDRRTSSTKSSPPNAPEKPVERKRKRSDQQTPPSQMGTWSLTDYAWPSGVPTNQVQCTPPNQGVPNSAPQVTPMREILGFKPSIDLPAKHDPSPPRTDALSSSKPASNRSTTPGSLSKNERSFSTNYEFAAPTTTNRTSKGSVCMDDLAGGGASGQNCTPVMPVRTSRDSHLEIEPFWLDQAQNSTTLKSESTTRSRRGSKHRRSAPAFFKVHQALSRNQADHYGEKSISVESFRARSYSASHYLVNPNSNDIRVV